MAKEKLELYLKLSDLDSDDAINNLKLKKTRHSRCVKQVESDENDDVLNQPKKEKKKCKSN